MGNCFSSYMNGAENDGASASSVELDTADDDISSIDATVSEAKALTINNNATVNR